EGALVFDAGTGGDEEFMRIDNDGKVGIGTTGPAELLHVKDATGGKLHLQSTGTDSWAYTIYQNDARVWRAGVRGDVGDQFTIYDQTAAAHRMLIDTSGNVGIGVTPDSTQKDDWRTLSIGENTYISGETADSAGRATVFANNAYLNNSSLWKYRITASEEASRMVMQDGIITFANSSAGTGGNTITFNERMRIDSSGNVGIGTTDPKHALHVYGNIGIRSWSDPSNPGHIGRPNGTGWGAGSAFFKFIDDTTSAVNGPLKGTRIEVWTHKYSGGTNLCTSFGSNGQVGIGTNEPVRDIHILRASGEVSCRVAYNGSYYCDYSYDYMDCATSTHWDMKFGGSPDFLFYSDGVAKKSSGAGDWANYSDSRLKTNIEDLSVDALATLNSLRPVEFNWKKEELYKTPKDSNGKSYGFIAQEIESTMPQLVTEGELSRDDEQREYVDEDGIAKSTELGHMASLYIKAIQQLTTRLEALENA
ncbi:MAG: tail fiber domain-containing protein, partial [Anaerolineales bacterium]|nr:tail fiber domain-containing protein [Anaerolineales bacterium]